MTEYKAPTYKGKNGIYEVVIGLEVHCQISSESKLFSTSPTTFTSETNTNVNFVDMAMPGMLPVLNSHCVDMAIKTGLGFHGVPQEISRMARKNYFYPDLPQGYQISQADEPIVKHGHFDIFLSEDEQKRITIERLHIEQDAGKLVHDKSPNSSYIDLNRCGIGLMEIVTNPDMRSAEEAVSFVRELQLLLRKLKTCDGNMEEGSMRVDINVSLRKVGESTLGTRTETKNVNSFKFMTQAIDYEIKRQLKMYDTGEEIAQETRLFNTANGKTKAMRTKENADDYRYFPDPDILTINISSDKIANIKKNLPELPLDKKIRFKKLFGISLKEANLLVSNEEVCNWFEHSINSTDKLDIKDRAKLFIGWLLSDIFGWLNKRELKLCDTGLIPAVYTDLMLRFHSKDLPSRISKTILTDILENGGTVDESIKRLNITIENDDSKLEKIIDKIIISSPNQVAEYKSGKESILGWFIGQAMKETKGQCDPQSLQKIFISQLTKITNE
ncbi:MAG: Asp-tRNA(Asn)/Glu-tRNA(Gln) amidotransferase subunit GatB [Alphaproteobacteria bacterium]|nr:Asp-tRNA(Asn)/Glu-tRNA(Gln) amidotransferase subunit GatB [Alphaproteobacteria bacterium]MBL0717956.1 Asp-tRNA(Asn)/Glu-tRNA(Gln) amidotransferase subunit GatB [Alphaproteobacteria bacterium]